MATRYALTTPARVKTRIGITTSVVDDVVAGMTYAATDIIEKYCGRKFKAETYENVIFDGLNQGSPVDFLLLPNAPVSALSAFHYNAGTLSNPSWQPVNADTYVLDKRLGGIQMVGGTLPHGVQNLRVTYTGGYLIDFANSNDDAQHNLPFDISDLAERITVKLYNKREVEGQSVSNFGESNITWEAVLTEADKQLLNSYRRNLALGV